MMFLLYKLLAYSNRSNSKNKAAIVIQRKFREYIKIKDDNRNKLINSMRNRISTSYMVVSIDKYGSTLTFNDSVQPVCKDDSYWNEDNLLYLKERKRIKNRILS